MISGRLTFLYRPVRPGVALPPLTVPIDADTGIGEIVSVKVYEPLEEPVPKKRRPGAAPTRRSDDEVPVKQREDSAMSGRACANCRGSLEGRRSDAGCCSRACRAAASRTRRAQRRT